MTLSRSLVPNLTLAALAFTFACGGSTDSGTRQSSTNGGAANGGARSTGGASALGELCKLNSDCPAPLLCQFGRCHAQCETSRDCPAGSRCVVAGSGNVCQLAVESHCIYDTDCPVDLVCAVDAQCRNQCSADADCNTGQLCAGGTCAEPSELDASGHLRELPEAGAP